MTVLSDGAFLARAIDQPASPLDNLSGGRPRWSRAAIAAAVNAGP
jgi:hypothetical protein